MPSALSVAVTLPAEEARSSRWHQYHAHEAAAASFGVHTHRLPHPKQTPCQRTAGARDREWWRCTATRSAAHSGGQRGKTIQARTQSRTHARSFAHVRPPTHLWHLLWRVHSLIREVHEPRPLGPLQRLQPLDCGGGVHVRGIGLVVAPVNRVAARAAVGGWGVVQVVAACTTASEQVKQACDDAAGHVG